MAGPASVPFPRELAGHAKDVLEGRVAPVTPRDAATVMLLRPAPPGSPGGAPAGGGDLQVYMLKRKSSMKFAPGAYVFPGGSVDPRDADESLAWAGPDADQWGQLFDAPGALARALVCAAVRETFEESGVMLAGPSAGTVVEDTTGADWEADRMALLDRSLSLAEMLTRRRLVLRSDLLRPWSRWITPEVEARRFDARFFAAELPAGQRTRDVGGEADQVTWVRPADAIAAGHRGEIEVWFPTESTLRELADCGTIEAVLRAHREVAPIRPEVTLADDGTPRLSVPGAGGPPR